MSVHEEQISPRSILRIEKGQLGPVAKTPDEGIEIRPFTLFIGKQGTGKSLVSQLVYFFENLPFLSKYFAARVEPQATATTIIRRALDSLRSANRAFATFAAPSVTITWHATADEQPLSLSMDRRNRRVRPAKALEQRVEEFTASGYHVPPGGGALFVPAERVLYSHGRPTAWQLLSLPVTLVLFADMMEQVGELVEQWEGEPDTEEGQWARQMGREMLRGEAYRWQKRWKWRVDEQTQMDIDMASSGQKANWPLALLAQVLPTWRRERFIGWPFSLHVEEPEIHLHPEAQVLMVHLLAHLVRQGFRVVVSTHSLTVLYALNNLLLASALGEQTHEGVPPPEVRLSPEKVAAYLFDERGGVHSLLDEEERFVDEEMLGAIDALLGAEMNRIMVMTSRKGSQEPQDAVFS